MAFTTDQKRVWTLFSIIAVVNIAADQLTKMWAKSALADGRPHSVIENFWDWQLAYNPGSAFSLFRDASWGRVFLTLVGLVALGAIFWMVHQCKANQRRQIWALGFIAGGAIGNLIDRLLHGVVTDFVLWRYYDKDWPIFNVADVALCIGVGLLLLDMIKSRPDEDPSAQESEAAS